MKRYKDIDGYSGIIAYEIFDRGINVVLRNNMMYTYSKKLKPGQLDEMIRLAKKGE